MYQPAHFVEQRPELLHALIAAYPLASLMLVGPDGIEANPVPLLLDPARGPLGTLYGHVAINNPLLALAGQPALVQFHGPDAYVSPGWYPSKQAGGKVVPTWNYALVEARGPLQTVSNPTRLEAILSALTDRFEASQPEPWTLDHAPADFRSQLYRAIVGIEIPLTSLTGKFKLSQNRPAADYAGTLAGLAAEGSPHALAVADWMQRTKPLTA
ncbi:FMN-binding negative transcriptional regulator [Chitinimonas sp.]|uniref:FMN-binding negative transcriptional regulator n=1 Tax=Chitinimonas sp. TaxID=1934313 RepID=UPI002F946D6A